MKSIQSGEPSLTQRVNKPEDKTSQNLFICGLSIGSLSRTNQFLICVCMVFILFILYGYCQELIFHVDELKKNGMFVTLVQFGFYSLFGLWQQGSCKNFNRKAPYGSYVLLAFLTIGTMGFSNTSLGYLNYPTQVIFKSSKLIPVMIGGILIQGKVYKFLDFLACFTMSVGLIVFTWGDNKISPNFDLTGIILISLALICDAVIGNYQELTLRKYQATNAELVFYSYGIGFLILLCGHAGNSDTPKLTLFLIMNPRWSFMIFLFSITGYIGILFVLQIVRVFGALPAVTVTTCRKAVTIVLSFLFFTKPFTMHYFWGGILVLLGIGLNLISKNKDLQDVCCTIFKRVHKSNTQKTSIV
uniref:Adenosine 3'-phospho 5'-phosphosulfate transporter 2 n=1 Tax=Phallusia mammillata TaxID=59560 RepID=A0A6F9DTN3_9ASCI|nr:adenosine 3'-phospho 5'-phosphosulfate transporter 2-like [Phallusia mammillata]